MKHATVVVLYKIKTKVCPGTKVGSLVSKYFFVASHLGNKWKKQFFARLTGTGTVINKSLKNLKICV